MKIYHYDPETGLYAGQSEAQESPLEPGKYLIPANATDKAPTVQPKGNEALVWTGSGWAAAEDHRGRIWYDTETGHPVRIAGLRPPRNTTPLKPLPDRPSKFENGRWVTDEVEWRIEREQELEAALRMTDWMVLPDSPVQGTELAEIKQWRAAVRALHKDTVPTEDMKVPEAPNERVAKVLASRAPRRP